MNIIITGASKGIGYHTALSLCSKNIRKIYLISRSKEGLISLQEKCREQNSSVETVLIPADINELSKDASGLLSFIADDSIDVLINNAGYLVSGAFEKLTDSDIYNMLETNFVSPVRLMRTLMKKINKSTRSHILNISSMGGFQGSLKFSGLSIYSASKAAIAILTESLAEEYKDSDIRFNCLALGAVQTQMLEEAFPGYQAPLTAKDMGKYIAEFALEGHNYYNGKILPVTISNP